MQVCTCSHFRVFALRCAVTHSAVLACEWKGRSGEEGGVGGYWADEWEGKE